MGSAASITGRRLGDDALHAGDGLLPLQELDRSVTSSRIPAMPASVGDTAPRSTLRRCPRGERCVHGVGRPGRTHRAGRQPVRCRRLPTVDGLHEPGLGVLRHARPARQRRGGSRTRSRLHVDPPRLHRSGSPAGHHRGPLRRLLDLAVRPDPRLRRGHLRDRADHQHAPARRDRRRLRLAQHDGSVVRRHHVPHRNGHRGDIGPARPRRVGLPRAPAPRLAARPAVGRRRGLAGDDQPVCVPARHRDVAGRARHPAGSRPVLARSRARRPAGGRRSSRVLRPAPPRGGA